MKTRSLLTAIALVFLSIHTEAQWVAAGDGVDNYVWGSCVYNGELYAAGNFEHSASTECLAIAKWNGSSWNSVGGGFQHNAFSYVIRGLIVHNNELYAGGYVDSCSGQRIYKIAKWNGSAWSGVGTDCPISTVNCFAVHNGELYAGGEGSGINPVCVAKWNGSNWVALDHEGGTTNVWAMTSYNGSLYVAGGFTNFNGQTIGGVAKWDGTSWSDIGTGFGALQIIRALAVFNNKLYIGGTFTTAGGVSASNIVAWDGTNFTALAGGVNAQVQSLLSYGNRLFVGGTFWQVNGVTANRSAYWNGSAWTVLGTDLGAGAKTLQVYNNELYSLGEGAFNGQSYVAKWSGGTFSGVEDQSVRSTVSLYPNPSKGEIRLQLKESEINAATVLQILDLTGKEVRNIAIDKAITVHNLSDLSPAIYMYRVYNDKSLIGTGKLTLEK